VENYIISNKTIAILKKDKKTFIYDVDNIRVINKNINKILELNCYFYGIDLNLIKNYAKNILNVSYKVPIYIKNDIILIQLCSLRNKECLILNSNKIINYKLKNKTLEINCENFKFSISISKNILERMLLKTILLTNKINNKKS